MLLDDEQRQYWVLGGRQPDGVRSECFDTVSPIVDPWRGQRQIVRDPPVDNSIALGRSHGASRAAFDKPGTWKIERCGQAECY